MRRYRNDGDFSLAVRQIPALAFVPAQHVDVYFGSISNHLDINFPQLTHAEQNSVSIFVVYSRIVEKQIKYRFIG